MVRFLVIRFSSIGDIVLTTPVVRCLKKQVPDAEIHFLTKESFRQIVENNPYIDKVLVLKKSLNETIRELKQGEYDYIIDLHGNLRTAIIKSRLGLIAFTYHKLNLKKWILTNFKVNLLPPVHIVDRYMETLRIFDVCNDEAGLDYFIPKNDIVDIEKILPKSFINGYIAFVIGAKHQTKQLFPEKIVEIVNGINKPVLLLGGNEDREKGETIATATKTNVYNACGLFTLNQSASLVQQAKIVIAHDTGLMHIASALKKKIAVVWGSTVPEFGMGPYKANEVSVNIEVKNIRCRPCSKLGYKKCPKGHFNCMRKIDDKEIYDFVLSNF